MGLCTFAENTYIETRRCGECGFNIESASIRELRAPKTVLLLFALFRNRKPSYQSECA